jgi:protein SCO1/2
MRVLRFSRWLLVTVGLALGGAGCTQKPEAREFQVVGQVVRIDRSTNYVTLRHEDIAGFMPAMTMPFAVKPPALLEGREPGDLVTATLYVDGAEAWLGALTKTGHAPLPPAEATAGAGLVIGDRLPDQTFTDQQSQPLALAWLDGRVSAITFVYTRCPLPEFCPAIDSRFRVLQQEIARAPAGTPLAQVRLLSVTIDPAFDTPPVLAAHAAKLDARPDIWRFATAPADEVATFGRQFGLDVRASGTGAADIEHNLRTIILDRDRRIVEMLTGAQWTAGELVRKVRAAAGA